MKARHFTALLLLVIFLLSCVACNPAAKTSATVPIQTSPPPTPELTLEQLLADALNLLDGGKYEEAILAYNHIIEIELKNFDAQFGLGKAYRGAKQPDMAVTALKAAKEIQPENVDATLELGGALLDAGSYAEAETLLLPLAGETEFNPQAGVLLALAYYGLDKVDEAIALLQRDGMPSAFEDDFYLGSYNVERKREGKGIGLYKTDKGSFTFIGSYENGMRSGYGIWLSKYSMYKGEWKQDSPNGKGVFVTKNVNGETYIKTGTYKNGLENGEITYEIKGHVLKYIADEGIPRIIRSPNYNGKVSHIVVDYDIEGNLFSFGWEEGTTWGVWGWSDY